MPSSPSIRHYPSIRITKMRGKQRDRSWTGKRAGDCRWFIRRISRFPPLTRRLQHRKGRVPRGLTIAIVAILVIAACGMVIVKDMQVRAASCRLRPRRRHHTPTPVPTPVPTATPVPTPTVPVSTTAIWGREMIYDQYLSIRIGIAQCPADDFRAACR